MRFLHFFFRPKTSTSFRPLNTTLYGLHIFFSFRLRLPFSFFKVHFRLKHGMHFHLFSSSVNAVDKNIHSAIIQWQNTGFFFI